MEMRLVQLLRGVGARVKEAAVIGLRQATPMLILGVGDIANKISQGLSGIRNVAIMVSAAMFAVGAILAVLYFTSRGLRERGKELIEGAIILCAIIGVGGMALAFASEIGQAIGGGEKVEATEVNPWK